MSRLAVMTEEVSGNESDTDVTEGVTEVREMELNKLQDNISIKMIVGGPSTLLRLTWLPLRRRRAQRKH